MEIGSSALVYIGCFGTFDLLSTPEFIAAFEQSSSFGSFLSLNVAFNVIEIVRQLFVAVLPFALFAYLDHHDTMFCYLKIYHIAT
jgi:hypothetical protein